MKTIAGRISKWCLIMIVCSGILSAAGSAPIPIGILTDKSDAVIVGKIVNISVKDYVFTLNIEVEQSFKGELKKGRLFPADLASYPGMGWMAKEEVNDRGVFFLKRSGGKWSIFPVLSGALVQLRRAYFRLPASSEAATISRSDPSVHERVLAELIGVLKQHSGQGLDWLIDFMWEYRTSSSPEIKSIFLQAASSPNLRIQALALRAGISEGSETAFAQMEQLVARKVYSAFSGLEEEIQNYFKTPDSSAVASIGRMATSTEAPSSLRKACLTALARIHTRPALTYLAHFLDSSDVELQSLAVGGLAMFANNVPIGGHGPAAGSWPFRTEDTLKHSAMDPRVLMAKPNIVGFWKHWWEEHRSELVSAAR